MVEMVNVTFRGWQPLVGHGVRIAVGGEGGGLTVMGVVEVNIT